MPALVLGVVAGLAVRWNAIDSFRFRPDLFDGFFFGMKLAAVLVIALLVLPFFLRCGLVLGVLVLMQFGAEERGRELYRRDCDEAIQRCEQLMPGLERVRATTGSYPKDLGSLLPRTHPLPLRLLGKDYYNSRGDSYEFSFSTLMCGATVDSTCYYDSRLGKWWSR